jgi:predicted nuclease of predicted toxin-antitoxin system
LRFLIDTNLPRRLTAWLASRGHQCTHVLDLGLGHGSDNELWTHCLAGDAIIVSKDEDFANWVHAGRPGPSVLWLRTGNGTVRDLIQCLAPVIADVEARLAAGERLVEVRSISRARPNP